MLQKIRCYNSRIQQNMNWSVNSNYSKFMACLPSPKFFLNHNTQCHAACADYLGAYLPDFFPPRRVLRLSYVSSSLRGGLLINCYSWRQSRSFIPLYKHIASLDPCARDLREIVVYFFFKGSPGRKRGQGRKWLHYPLRETKTVASDLMDVRVSVTSNFWESLEKVLLGRCWRRNAKGLY